MQILLIVTHLLFFINPKQHFSRSSSNNYPLLFYRLTILHMIAALLLFYGKRAKIPSDTRMSYFETIYVPQHMTFSDARRHQSNKNLPLVYSSSLLARPDYHISLQISQHTQHTHYTHPHPHFLSPICKDLHNIAIFSVTCLQIGSCCSFSLTMVGCRCDRPHCVP
jgi:hypothetical protein